MSSSEVSKPVMVSVIIVAVVVIGLVGWYFFMRPQKYPGYQAPTGPVGGSRGIPGGPGPGFQPGGGRMPGAGIPGGPGAMPGGPTAQPATPGGAPR